MISRLFTFAGGARAGGAGGGRHLDGDGLELGDDVAEDGELEAEEDEDAYAVGEDGVGGHGEAVEGELADGEISPRLRERVQAGAEEEEERVDGYSRGDPPGGRRAEESR